MNEPLCMPKSLEAELHQGKEEYLIQSILLQSILNQDIPKDEFSNQVTGRNIAAGKTCFLQPRSPEEILFLAHV